MTSEMKPLDENDLTKFLKNECGFDLSDAQLTAHEICAKFSKPQIKLPERKEYGKDWTSRTVSEVDGWNACLQEVKKLNGIEGEK